MLRASSDLSAAWSALDWQQAFELLDVALDLDASAQAAWLASLGPEQATLRLMVEKLLQNRLALGAGEFMSTPAYGVLAEGAQPRQVEAQALIGPYRLVRQIGQGGMADVWLAVRADGLLDRPVALKLPHTSWGGALHAERMARERQILASLTHPHIARLYDAGIGEDGRPYLALEYVAGQPIDEYARAHTLSVRARVELMVQVARAVAYAHAQLVVHRDIKPSNILVDAAGQVRLLDFGIAKIIDPLLDDESPGSPLTQMHGRALTPDYASPEQIRGDAMGTSSDVYSLGIVMFELLAGERPYRLPKGLGAVALAEAVARASVPRLSAVAADRALKRQLQGDLDAIAHRALAKASDERYATMEALADDLERHLAGLPVRARPDSRWYLAERWVRRHKLETAVALAIIVALPAGAAAQVAVLAAIAAGAGVALWQARAARAQAQRAGAEAARAAAVKGFLTSFFESGSLDKDGGALLGRLTVREFVERGAARIDTGFERQPQLKAELYDVVSALFADLSDGNATVTYARKWLASLDRFRASEAERARAQQRLARGLILLGQYSEAIEMLASSIARLTARNDTADVLLLAELWILRARATAERGDHPNALAGVDAAYALLVGTGAADDRATDTVRAEAQFLRAELIALDNRQQEAVPQFEEAIALLERIHGERSLVVARHRFIYGKVLGTARQDAQTVREYRHALRLVREAGGADDLNSSIIELDLGRHLALRSTSRAEGLTLLDHARHVFAARIRDVSPSYPATANLYLAEALIDQGELELAREPMEAAAAHCRDKIENAGLRSLVTLVHARYLADCGDYDGSDRLLESCYEERVRTFGPEHPLSASVVNRIGMNHSRRQDYARAISHFEQVLQSQDHVESSWGSVKHQAQINRAVAYLESGAVAQALPVFQEAVDRYLVLPPASRNDLTEATICMQLGRALLAEGQPAPALHLLQRSVDIFSSMNPLAANVAFPLGWLGLCLLELGRPEQARVHAEAAREALTAHPLAGAHFRRSLALLDERLAAAGR